MTSTPQMVVEGDNALQLLANLGQSLEDVLAALSRNKDVPTFGEFVPVVLAAMAEGPTRRQYGYYLNKLLRQPGWADKRLDEPSATDLRTVVEHFKTDRIVRRNSRHGIGSAASAVSALRCLYRFAQDDGIIDAAKNPAARLQKPARPQTSRQAIADEVLAEIYSVAATTGNDPGLDTLLLRLHTETACRRCGALRLRPQDLDEAQSIILLREKRWAERWQPVSPTLMNALLSHQRERGAEPHEQLLRFRDHHPLSKSRYSNLWTRIYANVPMVAERGITTHWLRHTTLTWVERNFGKAVARQFAGHGARSVTDIYTAATIHEVALAVAVLTGEPHPLAAEIERAATPVASPAEGALA